MYNYIEEIKKDIRSWLWQRGVMTRPNRGQCEILYERLFVADEVTGNGTGSYRWNNGEDEARECLIGNDSLVAEVTEPWGEVWSASEIDVAIRCHLLEQCLNEVLGTMRRRVVSR